LIAAAEAAASWARARRATWTARPVDAASPAPAAPRDVAPAAPQAVVPPPVVAPPKIVLAPPAIEIKPAHPRATAPAPFVASDTHSHEPDGAASARSFGAVKWLVGAGVAAAVIGGAYVVWPYLSKATSTVTEPTAAKRPAVAGQKGIGSLRVTTTPSAAQVLVDGKARGVSPITLNDLSAGSHEVELKSNAGTVRRTVTIAANETAALDESIFAGWVTVLSPFEVVITEGGRVLRSDERSQFMLAPGTHDLRLSNRALGFQVARKVEVKPGEGATVRVTPPPSTLIVTANEAAQVWVDGSRVGETPLSGAPVQLGTHDILVKSTTGSERRYTVTIGVNPYTLNVAF